MFDKDKVKGHNRVIKTKKGLKVTRVGNFLRKKDENRNRNIALGAGAVVLGVGGAVLLRKKGLEVIAKKANQRKEIADRVDGFINKELEKRQNNIPVNDIPPLTGDERIKKIIVDKRADFIANRSKNPKLLIPKRTSTKRTRAKESIVKIEIKKNYSQLADPWDSPIETIIEQSKRVVKNKEGMKLLSPVKKPNPRGNLLKTGGPLTSKERVVSRLANGYTTLPLPMKLTLQMEKAMKMPIREGVGRPPDTSGLKTILDVPKNSDIDTVIKKGARKVTTRLKGQAEKRARREAVKKNNS